MVALLDVNVLIALFDPAHVHHEAAHAWFGPNKARGWATCPITENAVVRILSNPSYPGGHSTPTDLAKRLAQFCASGHHSFWEDSVSLCDSRLFRLRHVKGHRQITDIYLLAIAVHRRGRLASFDGGIPLHAVAGARGDHLCVIRV
jgi:toxin-antitoxin system PIN domain toxin